MYLGYWRLKEEPFAQALDERFFYTTPQHEEGIARLVYTARHRKGGAILTGAYGTGKSMVRRLFLLQLSQVGSFSVVQIDNPLVTPAALSRDLVRQLGGRVEAGVGDEQSYHQVSAMLRERRRQGGHGIVIVEEAQLLKDVERIENVRLLMNLNDDQGRPLLTLILIGALEMVGNLAQSPSLGQRISSSWELMGLDKEQTRAYVTHRLSVAGGNGWIFDESAVDALHAYSRGIPRLLNNVADLSLYLGMAESAVRIDAALVERVVADIRRGAAHDG